MSEPTGTHPASDHLEFAPEGDGVYAFTPCHGARVFFPLDQAAPGARLRVVCPRDGVERLMELAADDSAETGVRPLWTDLEEERA